MKEDKQAGREGFGNGVSEIPDQDCSWALFFSCYFLELVAWQWRIMIIVVIRSLGFGCRITLVTIQLLGRGIIV